MGDLFAFKDAKVFITGGSSGIGKEIAREFLKLGACVTIVADQADKLNSARAELSNCSERISSAICDISNGEQVRQTAANYVRRFGPPDILINNAGFAVYRTFEEMESQEVERLLNVNLMGACLVTKEFLPAMIQARRGHIVMMASIAGRIPMTPCGLYCAAKHGLVAWAETLRAELYHYGIRVHAICPGRVETDFFSHETFVKRANRPEARGAVPVDSVARATIRAIQNGRFLTYVPWWYRVLAWLAQSFPLLARPALQRLMRSRVHSMSAVENGQR